MRFNLDLTRDTAATVEQGSYVPAGWYFASLDDVDDDTKSGKTVLVFVVSNGPSVLEHSKPDPKDTKGKKRLIEYEAQPNGPHASRKVFERLSDPDALEGDAVNTATKKIKVHASRLGLLKPEHFGQQADLDFADAIGASVVLHVVPNEYTNNGGELVKASQLAFDGIYPRDHDKIPAAVRAALGLPPGKNAGTGGASPTTQAARATVTAGPPTQAATDALIADL